MKASSDYILTSHVGTRPRPDDLIEANRAREAGGAVDSKSFAAILQSINVTRASPSHWVSLRSIGDKPLRIARH